ncbi:MAG: UDP-3-O-(3-hydroxymyristoyl)glucosamine N-acyltransferase [Syntrophobacteraceae bacterium]
MSENITARDSFSLRELSVLVGAELKGDPDLRVWGIGPLESASADQLSFVTDARHRDLIVECGAAALIVPPAFRDLDLNLLITKNPYLAMAKVATLFLGGREEEFAIHPSAIIGDGVEFGGRVAVGAYACVGEGCRIGAGTRIGGGCHLGWDVRVGEGCLIHPRVSILDGCLLGDRVIIHSGAVIGADGFGYAPDERGRYFKIPQTGIVQIDDDVEIGANATIDRATFGRTWIKRGAKIDNLVMIGHNSTVGEDSALAALVGVSGSCRIGDRVLMAGQVGVAGHLEIGDGAKIGAKSGIWRSVAAGQTVSGYPALSHIETFRNLANVQRLPKLKEELKRLRERVQKIEEALKEDDGHSRD